MLGPTAHEFTIIGSMLKSQLKRPLRRAHHEFCSEDVWNGMKLYGPGKIPEPSA
jgi:hypothetical protein